jgi:hypothetical protein
MQDMSYLRNRLQKIHLMVSQPHTFQQKESHLLEEQGVSIMNEPSAHRPFVNGRLMLIPPLAGG